MHGMVGCFRESRFCMTLLEFTISNLVDIRPIEVLNHAYKHGYPDLADRAAYCSLTQPLKDISRGLTHPGLLAKWVTASLYLAKH